MNKQGEPSRVWRSRIRSSLSAWTETSRAQVGSVRGPGCPHTPFPCRPDEDDTVQAQELTGVVRNRVAGVKRLFTPTAGVKSQLSDDPGSWKTMASRLTDVHKRGQP